MNTFNAGDIIKSAEINANFTGLANGTEIEAGAIDQRKISNPYMFKAYRSSSYEGASGGIYELDTVAFDPSGGFNTSTHKYTIPVTGYWQFDFRAGMEYNAGIGVYATLYKAGSQIMRGSSEIQAYTDTSAWGGSSGGGLLYLEQGEEIELRLVGTGDTFVGGEPYAFMSGFLVSET